MNNRKLYICVSSGNPKTYLDSCNKETPNIKEAAECITKDCAEFIIEEYKKNSLKSNDKIFIVEEYTPKFSISDFVDDKIFIPLWQFEYKHPNLIFWLPIVNSIIGIALAVSSIVISMH